MSECKYKSGFKYRMEWLDGYDGYDVLHELNKLDTLALHDIDDDNVYYESKSGCSIPMCDMDLKWWMVHIIDDEYLDSYHMSIISVDDIYGHFENVCDNVCKDLVGDYDNFDELQFEMFSYVWYNGTDDPMNLW